MNGKKKLIKSIKNKSSDNSTATNIENIQLALSFFVCNLKMSYLSPSRQIILHPIISCICSIILFTSGYGLNEYPNMNTKI